MRREKVGNSRGSFLSEFEELKCYLTCLLVIIIQYIAFVPFSSFSCSNQIVE